MSATRICKTHNENCLTFIDIWKINANNTKTALHFESATASFLRRHNTFPLIPHNKRFWWPDIFQIYLVASTLHKKSKDSIANEFLNFTPKIVFHAQVMLDFIHRFIRGPLTSISLRFTTIWAHISSQCFSYFLLISFICLYKEVNLSVRTNRKKWLVPQPSPNRVENYFKPLSSQGHTSNNSQIFL